MHQELKLFCAFLSSKIDDNEVYSEQSLEPERRHFLQMVNTIESADNCLSLHQSAAFACNVISICLILYSILCYPSFNSASGAMGTLAFWLFYAFADICVVITCDVLIKTEVSKFNTTCFIF